MSGRLKLKSIYPTFEEFSTFCMDTITEFYPRLVTDMPNSATLKNEIERYVFKPLYRQFKNATCRYLPTEEGIDAFNNQFSNQLEEVVFDFLVYTSTNLYYFNESYTKVGENLEQGVTTYNSPINQDITNTKSNTTIAKGATAQNINLMVYNGNTSWLKAFSSYYTPQRKAELIDKFRWLFISFYVGSDEGVTLVELSEALSMANGDMVITPEEAEILRKVIIEKPSTLIPENIKKGVDIGGVIGNLEEGGNGVNKLIIPNDKWSGSLADNINTITIDDSYKETLLSTIKDKIILGVGFKFNGNIELEGLTQTAGLNIFNTSGGSIMASNNDYIGFFVITNSDDNTTSNEKNILDYYGEGSIIIKLYGDISIEDFKLMNIEASELFIVYF